jgi:hypothetical protein
MVVYYSVSKASTFDVLVRLAFVVYVNLEFSSAIIQIPASFINLAHTLYTLRALPALDGCNSCHIYPMFLDQLILFLHCLLGCFDCLLLGYSFGLLRTRTNRRNQHN